MINASDSVAEGDISSSTREQIFGLWKGGRTLKQISQMTGLPIKLVGRILKQKQKPIILKGG